MTKVNENGQFEWTFEELDLEGALVEVEEELKLKRGIWKSARDLETLSKSHARIIVLQDVMMEIRWLIGKGGK